MTLNIEDNWMRIIHIKQLHKLPFEIKASSEVLNATIHSQFMVAQELKKHTRCPILREGLYEDASDASSNPLSDVAKMFFPKGFPTNFHELTSLQKEFLYDQGATFTLFYLGEIPSLYKSIHRDVSDIFDNQIAEGAYEKISAPREIEAIECAKEAAINYFGKKDDATVIIVFGGFHDFKPYCDKEGFEHEVVDARVVLSVQQNETMSDIKYHTLLQRFSMHEENKPVTPPLPSREESYSCPNLPWQFTEQTDTGAVQLATDDLKIAFCNADILDDYWELSVTYHDKKIGMLFSEDESELKNQYMNILKTKDVNQLLSYLDHGETATQMKTLLIDGMKQYETPKCHAFNIYKTV